MPRFFMVFMLLLLLLVPAANAEAPHPFHEPSPGLITGGQPDQAQFEQFAQSGGVLVIDLRAEDEDRGLDEVASVEALGLRYLNLPIRSADDITPENAAIVQQALEHAGGPVLLHCASGNRVGALLALGAVAHGSSRAEALDLGRRAGLSSLEPLVRDQLECKPEHC